ncbi:hypothetical protein ABVN80_19575 [Acinetobacter baumannii]
MVIRYGKLPKPLSRDIEKLTLGNYQFSLVPKKMVQPLVVYSSSNHREYLRATRERFKQLVIG